MDEFSYLTVLVSIILGLGITRLLKSLGLLIEERDHVRGYWPAVCWAMVLLLIHVQSWWAMFGMRQHHGWDFATFLVVLMQPVVLYLLAALVLPSPAAAGAPLDLRAHYHRQARWFFSLLGLLLLVSLVKSWMLTRRPPQGADLGFHLLFLALAAAAAIGRREILHKACAVLTAVLMATYIALLFSQLQ